MKPKAKKFDKAQAFYLIGRERGRREMIEALFRNDAFDKGWVAFQLHVRLEDLFSAVFKANGEESDET